MIKGGSKQLDKLGKAEFLRMRNAKSGVDADLTELEYYCLARMKEGYSVSYLAREVFGVHPVTLQKALTSVAFTSKLDNLNSAMEVISYDLCMKKLTDIIMHSTNDTVTISAIKVLCSLIPQITYAELKEALISENMSVEEAKEVLARFKNEEENADGKEETKAN